MLQVSTNKPSLAKRLSRLVNRIKLACQVIVAPERAIGAATGQLVTYDPATRRLVIEGDFEIRATGNLFLNSDQHVVLCSGNTAGQYTHGVWLNPNWEDVDAIHIDSQHRSVGESNLQPDDRQELAGPDTGHAGSSCGSCSCQDSHASN